MDYFVVKTIHQGAVALSITGFFARGLGALIGARWVTSRPAKTLPHLVDTVLLLSALTLAWLLRCTQARLAAGQIIRLLVYIGLGVVALKPGRPQPVRAAAWLGTAHLRLDRLGRPEQAAGILRLGTARTSIRPTRHKRGPACASISRSWPSPSRHARDDERRHRDLHFAQLLRALPPGAAAAPALRLRWRRLPPDATPTQRERFERGEGGALAPLMWSTRRPTS
jgi:uncharacterized membrane protein SirB2